jgi:hypothetical protein
MKIHPSGYVAAAGCGGAGGVAAATTTVEAVATSLGIVAGPWGVGPGAAAGRWKGQRLYLRF